MSRASVLVLVAVALLWGPHVDGQAKFRIVTTDRADEGMNDPTPVAPVGGNSGTTLGEQRMIAIQHAADLWGAILESPHEIIVHANFEEMSCSDTTAVLGGASASTVYNRFPNAPVPEAWYVAALASRLSGLDLAEGTPAVSASFNSLLIGDPACGGGRRWYNGLDGNAGAEEYDLVVVALHELGHGLGFSTVADKRTGRLLGGKPDIYSNFLLDNESGLLWSQMSDEQRSASAINSGRLVWSGANVRGAAPAVLAPRDLLEISVPSELSGIHQLGSATFGPSVPAAGVHGRIVAAVDRANSDGPTTTDGCTALSNASEIAGRIALIDRGECAFAVKAKRAQDAGAIAVIIVNSTEAVLTMTGNDSSIVIPAVSVVMSTGTAIRERLEAGVEATIRQDLLRHSGADDMHRVQMYAPEQVSGGSSVSHWDRAARPDLLMEPSISSNLGHDVDLARDLFADLGWFASAFGSATLRVFVLLDHDRDGLPDPGDTVRARATFHNRARVIGQGLTLRTTIPPGISIDAESVTGGTVAELGESVRIDAGAVAAGGAHDVTFDLMIGRSLSSEEEPVLIQGFFSGANTLAETTDDPSTPEVDDPTRLEISHTPLFASHRVTLDDRDQSGGLSRLDRLDYLTTITNHRPFAVGEVSFEVALDPRTAIVPGSVTTTSGSVVEGDPIRILAGTVAPGETVQVRYTVIVESEDTESGGIGSQGIVSAPGFESQLSDDPSTRAGLDATVVRFPGTRSRAVGRAD